MTAAQWRLIDDRCRALGIVDDSELARRVGVVPSSVSHWRSGETGIAMTSLRTLARVLGITPGQLLEPETVAAGGPPAEPPDPDAAAAFPPGPPPPLALPTSDQPHMTFTPTLMLAVAYIGRGNAGEGGGHVTEGEVVPVTTEDLKGADYRRVGAVEIVGHCLEPQVSEGDHALVDPDGSPARGVLVAVRVKATDELIVKYWMPGEGGAVQLVPDPRSRFGRACPFDPATMEVLGTVFNVIRPKGMPTLRLADPRLTLIGNGNGNGTGGAMHRAG